MHWAYRSMGVRPQGGTSPTLTVSKVYAKKAHTVILLTVGAPVRVLSTDVKTKRIRLGMLVVFSVRESWD